MWPVDPITLEQAARILGVAPSAVRRMVLDGRLSAHGGGGARRWLSQADVEILALELYPWAPPPPAPLS